MRLVYDTAGGPDLTRAEADAFSNATLYYDLPYAVSDNNHPTRGLDQVVILHCQPGTAWDGMWCVHESNDRRSRAALFATPEEAEVVYAQWAGERVAATGRRWETTDLPDLAAHPDPQVGE